MKNFTKRLAISTVAAGTLFATAFAPGAFAQTLGDGTSATVTGGNLDVTVVTAGIFGGRSITGEAQETTADLAFTVEDLRGSGAGWHVTAQASPFTGAGTTTPILSAGSLSLSAPSVAPATAGVTSPVPSSSVAQFIDNIAAVQIASAALGEGMGTYNFSGSTMTLSLPADVLADVYTSTVTLDAISGP